MFKLKPNLMFKKRKLKAGTKKTKKIQKFNLLK